MKWLFSIIIFIFSFSSDAAENENKNKRLVVAHFDKVELVGLDSRADMLVAGNKFQVTISNIEIIHGEGPEIKGKHKVILYADDLFEIKQAKQVALLIQYADKKGFKVMAWEPIRKFVCFSQDLVDKKYEEYYWNDRSIDHRKCVFVNSRIGSLKYDDE